MQFKGRVVKQIYGAGTKSEHEAVCLVGPHGSYKLRLPSGNPFADPRLDRLVGKLIVGDGTVDRVSNQLFLKGWSEESEQGSAKNPA